MSERSVPRAPGRDGAVVAEPPLQKVGAVLAINRRRLDACADRLILSGRSLAELRRAARASVMGSHPATDLLVVAGHQPELFHPGVWVKNFALYGLAQAHHAAALNLVIDNDIVKTTALRIPVLSENGDERTRTRTVSFDRWTGETPYEERTIADREWFASFAERAAALMRGWNFEPLLPSFWTEVLRQAEQVSNLGECFAAARRTFERSWGCHNMETPLSAVCRTEPFAWFACHLLAHLPRFHAVYNAVVADYRRRHGIRSRNHPVPDLAVDGDWLEAPLWAWRPGAARRGRLFVRSENDGLELRVGEDRLRIAASPEAAVNDWRTLESQGLKVRSRALTTTLYARLFLADLFVHGIGGGTYDELTDELMRRFYQCEPPLYLVLSATRWLPLPRAAVTPEDYRRLLRELRDVHYNPQRHLDESETTAELMELAASKQTWIASHPATAAERRERFHALRTLTELLCRPLRQREEQLRQQLLLCRRQLRSNAVLQRRDYSFCLFPADFLRSFCSQFLG